MKWIAVLAWLALMPLRAGATDAKTVREAIHRLDPGVPISEIHASALPGFQRALVGGRLVYVSNDGRYVLDGRVFDVHAMANLTDDAMRAIRVKALAALPVSQRLVYAPPHPRYTVTVFTDIDCVYCREFHKHIAQINAEGIAVQYLFWPRTGLKAVPSGRPTSSYLKAVAVWCAADRKAAFTAAKLGTAPSPADCPNPVAREYALGERIGIDATPTIIAADGSVLGGYLSPVQLLQSLQALGPDAADGGSPAAP